MTRIAVNQFAILTDRYPDSEITLNSELSFQYSEESRRMSCEIGYRFNSEGDETFLVLKCRCDFAIHPDDWKKFHGKDGFGVPKQALEMLAVHTIGTSRGILFCKTEHTPFSRLMIPPINVSRMMADESTTVRPAK